MIGINAQSEPYRFCKKRRPPHQGVVERFRCAAGRRLLWPRTIDEVTGVLRHCLAAVAAAMEGSARQIQANLRFSSVRRLVTSEFHIVEALEKPRWIELQRLN
jgi:hypothetical protein